MVKTTGEAFRKYGEEILILKRTQINIPFGQMLTENAG